ncbi:tyrosine-type recombinase/integrase [Marinobacter sp. 1-3A]|uniref:tyrosine-type recombinase/integrase n=1 Tax=Marinobacter sp. 1-3A TaxID=2582920 RepID=UPI00190742AE|nr:tyrosine-type recombinase/integrase [Marinobacter sp. 1-3A]MBK1874808.1 tyrosine-type recombinase/integrase [Marinobacter sp. 1-3A]
MYIQRSSFGVYYTRISLPKFARENGFPHSIRISLLTKCRKTAVKRNALVCGQMLEFLDRETTFCSREVFDRDTEALRNGLHGFFEETLPSLPINANSPENLLFSSSSTASASKVKKEGSFRDFAWLIRSYIKYKSRTRVSPKYLKQVEGRLRPLIGFFNDRNPRSLKLTDGLNYQHDLLGNGWSPKTVKEYLSVARQLCAWCVQMEYLKRNPFVGVKVILPESKAAHEQRQIWTKAQLQDLFAHKRFSDRGSADDMWVPLILLHSGLRPSEACQLRVEDVRKCEKTGIWYFNVSDDGWKQRIKTPNARRQVPLHRELLERGFLNYVAGRTKSRRVQLFNCSPTGKEEDWSRNFTHRFNRFLLNKLGYAAGNRPGSYSLRHTFVDALKQKDVPEHIVAEIVGHSQTSITFGRYGKPSGLKKKAAVINSVKLF